MKNLIRLFVCNYGEGGNLISSPVYSTGSSCSSCPPSTSCSLTYPGLCSAGSDQSRPSQSVETPEAPQSRPSHKRPPQLVPPQFSPSLVDQSLDNQLTSLRNNITTVTTSTSTSTSSSSCSSFFCLLTRPSIMVEGLMNTAHSMGDSAMTTVVNLSDFVLRFNSGLFG